MNRLIISGIRKNGLLRGMVFFLGGLLFFSFPALGKISKNAPQKKRVVMIVAPKNFRDEELFIPRSFLEERGVEVQVASAVTSPITGMLGARVKPDMLLTQVRVSEYDAVIFVGGQGATFYFNDEDAQKIARQTLKEGKILAAICLAPNILANAGLLKGKKATCWNSANLIRKGADYQSDPVVRDGSIITANGPRAAARFAETVFQAIQ